MVPCRATLSDFGPQANATCGIMVTLSQAVAPRFLTVQQWGSRSGGLVGGNQGLAGLADEHLTNKLANLGRCLWPAATRSRFPAPMGSETSAMPSDHGRRLENSPISSGLRWREERYIPKNVFFLREEVLIYDAPSRPENRLRIGRNVCDN